MDDAGDVLLTAEALLALSMPAIAQDEGELEALLDEIEMVCEDDFDEEATDDSSRSSTRKGSTR